MATGKVLVSRVCIYLNSSCDSHSEALRQTNLTMKERFGGLAAWREKQKKERDFLESRLEEARVRMDALTLQNQELSRRTGEEGKPGGAVGGLPVRLDLFSFLLVKCIFFFYRILTNLRF